MLTREAILGWPKTDLHCHLDGSLRLQTLFELASEQGLASELPAGDLPGLQRVLESIDDSPSLADFLVWFKYTIMVMQTREALHRIAYELVEDAAAENVRYLEVRYAPIESTHKGLTLEEANEAVLAGLRDGERDFGCKARLIVCGLRDRFESQSFRLAELAVAFKRRGVVAFDLAGGEAGNPAKLHVHAFAHAREHDLNLTCHAGEAFGPVSIRQALHDAGAHRIGHGVTLREDEDLLQYVVDHRIPLEMCPTSNVQTRVVEGYATHPIKEYVARKVRVTVNTDNRLFSRTTVTDELWRCHQHLGFDEATLKWIVLNGFKSAFLPYEERQALLDDVLPQLQVKVYPLEPRAVR